MTCKPTLRDRLIARNSISGNTYEPLSVPAKGRIDVRTVAAIHELALKAKANDIAARDCLWNALAPRLDRVSRVLKPWPNSAQMTGIWDRDDVRQESWIVFADLINAWDGTVNFVPYLLARFAWRLRDRILRGIGKRQSQLGDIRVPEGVIEELLVASDDERPESVAMARKLLEELLQRFMTGDDSPGELDAWLELINSRESDVLVSPDQQQDVNRPGKRSRIA